jgi:FtsH-binding integral membrane protein
VGVPAFSLDFDGVLVALSLIGFMVQIAGWIWVRRLARRMKGEHGGELVAIIAFLMGWLLVLRTVTLVGLLNYGFTDDTDLVVILSVGTQVAFLVLVFEVWRRLRRLMNGD